MELLYQELPKCGIVCEKYQGYEADDIVDWAVQQYRKNYTEVQIVGNDHDLLHSVQDKVWFKSVNPNCSMVYRGNFETEADKSYTVFNTISAKKVLCGCHSDSIPSITLKNGMCGKELYDLFRKFLVDNNIFCSYANTTSPRLLLVFAKNSGVFTNEDFLELQRRIKLVYPSKCPDDVVIRPNQGRNIDISALYRFLSLVGDRDSLHSFGGSSFTHLTEEEKKRMYDLSNRLKTGEYAADKNIPFTPTPVLKSMSIDLFEREV